MRLRRLQMGPLRVRERASTRAIHPALGYCNRRADEER